MHFTHVAHHVPSCTLLHGRCLHCGHEIVYVSTVGWIAPLRGESYDICPDVRGGAHEPDPEVGIRQPTALR